MELQPRSEARDPFTTAVLSGARRSCGIVGHGPGHYEHVVVLSWYGDNRRPLTGGRLVTGPAVRALDILSDGQTRDLLRNGFPARLHFRVELWHAGGIFNALDGTREWDIIARYDPLEKQYRAARLSDNNAVVDVEMLSLSDLDEVERWLRGELRPAVRGQRNPGGVLGRGLRSLFVRLLGAERRHYEVRSKTFKN